VTVDVGGWAVPVAVFAFGVLTGLVARWVFDWLADPRDGGD
jgi:hypothetical protein